MKVSLSKNVEKAVDTKKVFQNQMSLKIFKKNKLFYNR